MKNITIDDILVKGQAFEEEEKYKEALDCYYYALNIDKTNIDVLQKIAVTAQVMNLKDKAIEAWEKYIEIKPADALPYTQLMDLYYNDNKYQYYLVRAKLKTVEGRLAQAVDDYKKAISNTSEDNEIAYTRQLLAQSYVFLNKPLQAIDEYLKLLDHNPSEFVYLALADLYYSEDKNAALNVLMQAIDKFPDNADIKNALCKIFLATGDYEKAEQYATNNFDKIKAYLMQDKNDFAFDLLTNLSQKEKDTPQYAALIAEYYYNYGDDENTLKYIEIFEKAVPESPLPYQMRALVYEKNKNDFDAYFNWGKFYLKKNDFDLALNEFLRAFNLNSKNVDVLRELINLYSAMDDKYACIEFCEKLVKLQNDDIATLKRIIRFYDEQGYEENVIEYSNLLLKHNPRDYEILLKLARHAKSNKKYDDAIDYYEKYLKFAPNSDEKELIKKEYDAFTTGENQDDEGLVDKIIRFFSKK